jgi:nucleotide-binding universal stress UspA family protein
MKKIAILTDFSEGAENAAMYGLKLAQHIGAGMVLYDSFIIPSATQMGTMVAWPMESFEDLHTESEKQLNQLSNKLKTEVAGIPIGDFKPTIEVISKGGKLLNNLDDLLTDREIILLVIGNHKKGFSSLLTANHMSEMIDNITLPLLVVPDYSLFSPIKKIAFATDLSPGDIDDICSLAGVARFFNAEILVVHVTNTETSDKKDEEIILKEISSKANYPNIYYRSVKNSDVENGLDWMTQFGLIDMLAMVHRRKSFLGQIFHKSDTQRMAAHICMPLLIFPYPVHSLPVFES